MGGETAVNARSLKNCGWFSYSVFRIPLTAYGIRNTVYRIRTTLLPIVGVYDGLGDAVDVVQGCATGTFHTFDAFLELRRGIINEF